MKHRIIVCAAFAVFVLAGSAALAQETCVCGFGAVGDDGICFEDSFCFDRALCSSDADCSGGERCWIDNACPPPFGAGACAPVCDNPDCVNPARFEGFEECEPPLFVELASFEAVYRGGVVKLRWTTASETENVGFRIFRARHDTTQGRTKSLVDAEEIAPITLELVTAHMIPAAGSELEGAEYVHTDIGITTSGTHYYYLEDVDFAGKATLHGPVTVVVPGARVDHGRGAGR
jgi:hypothetical protein